MSIKCWYQKSWQAKKKFNFTVHFIRHYNQYNYHYMSTVQDNNNIFKQFLRKHPRWKEKITCSVLLIVSLRILLYCIDMWTVIVMFNVMIGIIGYWSIKDLKKNKKSTRYLVTFLELVFLGCGFDTNKTWCNIFIFVC